MRESTYDAVHTLREIVNDEDADAQYRLRAAELILDRTLGKAPEHVSLGIEMDQSPFARAFTAALMVGTEEQANEVIDAEIVEEDE